MSWVGAVATIYAFACCTTSTHADHLSIVLAAGGYCAVGWAVAGVLPTTELTFDCRRGNRGRNGGHETRSPRGERSSSRYG